MPHDLAAGLLSFCALRASGQGQFAGLAATSCRRCPFDPELAQARLPHLERPQGPHRPEKGRQRAQRRAAASAWSGGWPEHDAHGRGWGWGRPTYVESAGVAFLKKTPSLKEIGPTASMKVVDAPNDSC